MSIENSHNLIHPLLLGVDFLKKNKAILNFGNDTITLENRISTRICRPQWHNPTPTHLATAEEVTLDPYSCTLIKTSLGGPDPRIRLTGEAPTTMTVRPLAGDHEMELPVIAAWGIVDLKQDKYFIEVMNPCPEPLTIPVGVPMAMAENYDAEITAAQSSATETQPIPIPTEDGDFGIASMMSEDPQQPAKHPDAPIIEDLDESEEDFDKPIPATEDKPPDKPQHPDFKINLDVPHSALDDEWKKKFEGLYETYDDVVASHPHDLGLTKLMRHYVTLTTDKPVYAPYYKAPPPDVREEIDKHTDELIAMGVARESKSPYSAPIVLVRKKDGFWRYCTDFRKLNKITEKVSFPLPNINDAIRRFADPRVFTTLDLLKGYHQVEINEPHKKYFGFSDGRRHLEYNRTPMGAVNSGATMATLMELVLRGLPLQHVLCYLDDIIIATPDVESHYDMTKRVLHALQ